MITLTIAGISRTAFFRIGSLRITDDLNSRNTCSFSLVDTAGIYRPAVGQGIEIRASGVLIFAGTIDEVEENQPAGTRILENHCSCVDFNQITDRRLVAQAYDNRTLQWIVRDIVASSMAGEGITTVNTQLGPVIQRAVFNYISVAEAFNELASLTGFSWNISYTRDLHFFARETNVAPFALTNNFRDMQVKRTREQYRNQQIVRAGQDQTDVRTERFRGDGTLKSFLLSLPVATVPTVTVNGTAQTVGIRGLETGRAWYWQKGDSTITQDDVPAALGTADNLAVTYRGQFPILLVAQKTDEIRTRAAVEGGTGIYEALFNDQNIDGVILAEQKAEGLLRRYGRIPQTVTCETDAPGLAAGQLITITVPAHNLHGQYLIDSVQAVDIAGRLMRYRVRALDGEHLGGWVEFFQAMAAAGRQFVIRENEVLIRQSLLGPNVILCGDSITISSASPESRIGHLMIGFGEVA